MDFINKCVIVISWVCKVYLFIKVKIQVQLTETFGIDKGLRQGNVLSTALFGIVLQNVIRNTETNPIGTIFNRTGQYAIVVWLLGRWVGATEEVVRQINALNTFYIPPALIFRNSVFCPQCIYMFSWISEQSAIISLYSINLSVFKTEVESVYCAVRTGSLNQTDTVSYLKA